MTSRQPMKTPGVFIQETNAFPNAVVGVDTAVPAFIGYTERVDQVGRSVRDTPLPVASLDDFHHRFGGGPGEAFLGFILEPADGAPVISAPGQPLVARDAAPFRVHNTPCRLTQTRGFYLLDACLRQFFLNGGRQCYVVSVGTYQAGNGVRIDRAALAGGLKTLEGVADVTLVVIPEAVLLPAADCSALQQDMLAHCGRTMRNRFAILDVHEGYRPATECIEPFRAGLGTADGASGAAYYPWLHTTIHDPDELSHSSLDPASRDQLATFVPAEFAELKPPPLAPADVDKIRTLAVTPGMNAAEAADTRAAIARLASALHATSHSYQAVRAEMAKRLNLLPPAAAMAGVYTRVDDQRGVWQAPANVGVSAAEAPAVRITDVQQADLNVSPRGRSINAIRDFPGQGTLVWGARTLEGNSLDWRYISVRRTLILLEESIRLALRAYVFAPNDSNTWLTIRSMIANFLTGIWLQGGLAGSTPEASFAVKAGLGETMTPPDILDGRLRVTVMVALVRPAEFIEIAFEQTMQKA